MNIGARTAIAFASYAGAVLLFWNIDFGDRGYAFHGADGSQITSQGAYALGDTFVLDRSIGHINSNYVDPTRVHPKEMLIGALERVEGVAADVFFEAVPDETAPEVVRVTVGDKTEDFGIERVDSVFSLGRKLKEILRFIDAAVPEDASREDIEFAAINGMLQTLDPHSVLLSPDVYGDMQVGTSGRFGGLGIVVRNRKLGLTVDSVMEDTPAFAAGLKASDRITQIGEDSTVNMSLDEAVDKLRGEVDTAVTVWIERKGWQDPRPFTITRKEIRIESAQSQPLGDGVGYVRLKHFQQTTFDDLTAHLDTLRAQGALSRGLVLDLRGNPGGLLDQAIQVSDLFLAEGAIVATVSQSGKQREERAATEEGTLAELPVVVLVNSASASASEIVTGALKNNQRALVLGEQTFGKGSVQVVYEIDMHDDEERKAALKLTVAQYLTPGDQSIQSVGVASDIHAYPVSLDEDRVDLYVSPKDLMGEKDLDNHLDHERAKAGLSAEILRYYQRPDDEDDEPEDEGVESADGGDAADEQPLPGQVEPDYLMKLAHDILVHAGAPSRTEMLEKARPLLAERRDEEQRRVQERLTELGVDWTSGPEAPAGAQVRATLAIEGGRAEVGAGEKLALVAAVTNLGSAPLHRVRGTTKSANDLLDDRELIFGRVGPGETRQWKIEIDVPKGVEASRIPVELELHADNALLESDTAPLTVAFRPLATPRFAYSFRVDDAAKGNGDGVLQAGEEVSLRVLLGNLGEGRAHKVRTSLRNESGSAVFITDGREELEQGLEPGASAELEYAFRIKEVPADGAVTLKLGVADSALGEHISGSIELPVEVEARPLDREPGAWVTLARGAAVRAGASGALPTVARVARAGSMAVAARSGDWYGVSLGDGSLGWIAGSDLGETPRLASRTAIPTPRAAIEPTWARVFPAVRLADGSGLELETDRDHVEIEAAVHFAAGAPERCAVYVFRNDKKVYFQRVPTEPGQDASAEVRATVPLEPGINSISAYAREDGESVAQRRVYVYRR